MLANKVKPRAMTPNVAEALEVSRPRENNAKNN